MGYTEGGISNLACFFAKDCAEQAFLSGELGFTLRCYLTDKDISGTNLSTDTDNSAFVKVLKSVLADIRDVTGNLFRSKLCVTGFDFVFFDMNRCINIVTDKLFIKENGVLVVIAFPCHEADKGVLTKGDFAVTCCGAVGNYVAGGNLFAYIDNRALVNAGAVVGTEEFDELIGVDFAILRTDFDCIGANAYNLAGVLSKNYYAGVNGSLIFHTGSNNRVLGFEKRHSLLLHV